MNIERNKANCHPELDSGSRCSIKGFTLIELLVVVLIIGILSAIAVPQYQKAVLKSRFSSLMPTTQAIRDGNEMYYMTNGRYADAVGKLDVTATNDDEMSLTLSDDRDYAYTMATRPSIHNNLIMYQKHSTNFSGEIHCEALTGNTQAEWLCETGMHAVKSIGENVTPNYTTYVLEGDGIGMPVWAKDIDCSRAESLGLSCKAVNDTTYGVGRQMCINGVCRTVYEDEEGGYLSVTCKVNSDNVCTGMLKTATYNDDGYKISERYCETIDSNGACSKYKSGDYSYNYDYTYDDSGKILSKVLCTLAESDGTCSQYGFGQNAMFYEYDEKTKKISSERQCSTVNKDGTCRFYNSGSAFDYKYDEESEYLISKLQCQTLNSLTGKCTQYKTSGGKFYIEGKNENEYLERTCKTLYSSGCGTYDNTSGTMFYLTYDDKGRLISRVGCQKASGNSCSQFGGDSQFTKYDGDNKIYERNCIAGSDGKCSSSTYQGHGNYDYTYDTSTGKLSSKRECSSFNDDMSCKYYKGTEMYIYDDNGKQIASKTCYYSNVDPTTGECISYSTSTYGN